MVQNGNKLTKMLTPSVTPKGLAINPLNATTVQKYLAYTPEVIHKKYCSVHG